LSKVHACFSMSKQNRSFSSLSSVLPPNKYILLPWLVMPKSQRALGLSPVQTGFDHVRFSDYQHAPIHQDWLLIPCWLFMLPLERAYWFWTERNRPNIHLHWRRRKWGLRHWNIQPNESFLLLGRRHSHSGRPTPWRTL
jgi:hypothetical protein